MGSPTAIRATTDLLVDLLRIRLAGDEGWVDDDQIRPMSPAAADDDSPVRLAVYLYGVSKDGALNTGAERTVGERKERPPLALECHYLVVALPGSDPARETETTLEQHELLGLAMQAFYDAAMIDPDDLPEALGDEPLRVTLEQSKPTELTDVWSTFPDLPLAPCASYTVGPIRIPSTQSAPFERVSERDVRLSRREDGEE